MTREFNIHYRDWFGSLIHLLYTTVDLGFAVHNLAKFSAKPGKLHSEGLVHLLRLIRYNNTLVLKYYANINGAPVSDLLRQATIKTENTLMGFSDFSWKDCLGTGRSTGSYIIFIKVGKLTMTHMFEEYLLNQVQKVSTIQHALQEWI